MTHFNDPLKQRNPPVARTLRTRRFLGSPIWRSSALTAGTGTRMASAKAGASPIAPTPGGHESPYRYTGYYRKLDPKFRGGE